MYHAPLASRLRCWQCITCPSHPASLLAMYHAPHTPLLRCHPRTPALLPAMYHTPCYLLLGCWHCITHTSHPCFAAGNVSCNSRAPAAASLPVMYHAPVAPLLRCWQCITYSSHSCFAQSITRPSRPCRCFAAGNVSHARHRLTPLHTIATDDVSRAPRAPQAASNVSCNQVLNPVSLAGNVSRKSHSTTYSCARGPS
jgi:hypothetical protein